MVQSGKVYGNRMVDVAVTNKNYMTAPCGFCKILQVSPAQHRFALLERSGKWVKLALLIHMLNLEPQEGERLLAEHHGNLRAAVLSSTKC
jgi:N-acetylmuramic acid 6-phosphate etherase